jgi:plasmid stabilization system protein ParE
MDPYHIIITGQALADLEEITAHIRKTSLENARRVATRILNAIDALEFMPGMYKRAALNRKRGNEVHSRVVKPHIIYYRVQQHRRGVIVLRVIHGARRQPRSFD